MAERRLPLLRGRITIVESYESPQRGSGLPPVLPSLDPKVHRKQLLQQLDAIATEVRDRPESSRDDLAAREIVAVRPAADFHLAADQLDDVRSDARLIGVVPETGTVLLDVANPHLQYLRKKVEAFGDDAKAQQVILDDGSAQVRRAGERAIAPVDEIALARLEDLSGNALRRKMFAPERFHWFEVACRGGYRRPDTDTVASRAQMGRQLQKLGAAQQLEELLGPERVYFFIRLRYPQLVELQAATDCIYEIDLAPPPLRDLKLLDDVTTLDIKEFTLAAPADEAPAVVILDSGIASHHPLLKAAVLSATTAGPEIPSPEDVHGHGTKMAGIALYRELGEAIEQGSGEPTHWLQSSRLLVRPGEGTASDENYQKWPVLTVGAVDSAEAADPRPRDRVFVLAVTRTMQDIPDQPFQATLWSQTLDQLAFNRGRGRMMIVSAGNAREDQWLSLADLHPDLQLSEKIHQPGQASNALTVGAYTTRVELPNSRDYSEATTVATASGGISPYTSTGLVGNNWPIKPDVVLEGGNLARLGLLTDASVPTLSALTTSHRFSFGKPLGLLSMTSEASARAANLAALILAREPGLRPESVRGLIVHSARWTRTMYEQFPSLEDRLRACGYGVPDEALASECAQRRATVVIEDSMPNGAMEEIPKKNPPKRPTTKETESKLRRQIKLFRLPMPEDLLTASDEDVQLRVTLSYFAEPNKFGSSTLHGLDLKWDMQGPQESEYEFLERVNALRRPRTLDGKRLKTGNTKSFDWDLGIQLRSRGTVQSDRWRGKMSALVGDKLIAIVPVLGWWDQRRELRTQEVRFSLLVSVFGPGVYSAIRPRVEAAAQAMIEV